MEITLVSPAKTGIADIDIVANDTWIGTRSSAHSSKVIASAILKRPAAHCRVVASVSVGLQRERAHSGIVGTVVVIDQGGCSKGAVPRARGVKQKSCGAHCGIGIGIIEHQRSGANAGVVIAGASPKQRIPTKSCICSTAGEVTQRVASFRRRETGIATVRRRTERPKAFGAKNAKQVSAELVASVSVMCLFFIRMFPFMWRGR